MTSCFCLPQRRLMLLTVSMYNSDVSVVDFVVCRTRTWRWRSGRTRWRKWWCSTSFPSSFSPLHTCASATNCATAWSTSSSNSSSSGRRTARVQQAARPPLPSSARTTTAAAAGSGRRTCCLAPSQSSSPSAGCRSTSSTSSVNSICSSLVPRPSTRQQVTTELLLIMENVSTWRGFVVLQERL